MKRAAIADQTPAALGFRMPAEWDPHEATWMAWPHNRTDWPGKFAPIPWVYGEIIRRISPGEIVRLNRPFARARGRGAKGADEGGVDLSRVEFFRFPTDRGWTRDTGPIFVKRGRRGEKAIVRFAFNGWAKYSNWKKDCRIAGARRSGSGFARSRRGSGDATSCSRAGSIDVNGHGTILTTEECPARPGDAGAKPGTLAPNRSPRCCPSIFGASNVLWLGCGIAGDDTHGHVDDLCRFVDPRTVVLADDTNTRDVNYSAFRENRERLSHMRLENGSKIRVVSLPMPAPVVFAGQRLPASYANFYIANAAVLVPTFNDPNDRVALGILSELIPDRPVIGIHAVDLVWGLGTIHCMTQQQPA